MTDFYTVAYQEIVYFCGRNIYTKLKFYHEKQFLLGILGACTLAANGQTFKEWQDPEVNAVNRAPMHANFFAYETTEAATQAVKENQATSCR